MSDERMGLAGTLALLAATIAVVFGVALSRDDEAPTGLGESGVSAAETPLDPDELLELSVERSPAVTRRVERIRGIDFDEPPKPQVTDTEALRRLTAKEIAKPKAAAQIAASDIELKLVGLLEPDESLADVTADATAGAAAYYDPKEKELFLLGDAVPAGAALAEFVLAHELDHALEDQAFGLPKSEASSDDQVLAQTALVEGSATALMIEYAGQHLAVTDLLEETGALQDGAGDLPEIALAQVTFAYMGGQRFVDELRAAAGGGWDLVDFAYERRLPATTEQILHPEKYLEDEGALPVPRIPSPAQGWERTDSGTVGEFFTREMLRQEADELGADEAAAGWGGDRYALFREEDAPAACEADCREESAMGIVWRGDDPGEAGELETAVRDFVERALEGASVGDGTWELEGGWAAVAGTGDLVGLGLAPSAAMARALARRPVSSE